MHSGIGKKENRKEVQKGRDMYVCVCVYIYIYIYMYI